LKNEKKFFEENNRLTIRNQNFSNFDQYVKYGAVAKIIFIDCNFEGVNFAGNVIGSCDFQNCKFQNTRFWKSRFFSCRFQNCQIVESDLGRSEFDSSILTNCQFQNVDLGGIDFMNCEFTETTFENSNLSSMLFMHVEFIIFNWKSNKCLEIKKSSTLERNELIEKLWKDKDMNARSNDEE